MKIDQQLWSIQELVNRKTEINLNPPWQRGPSWREPRQVLLIDSILRGMDIPKIYLRVLSPGGGHSYDAVDGQQRLRAIWMFVDGELCLTHPEPLSPIEEVPIAGCRFMEIAPNLRDRFLSFRVSVAEIVEGDPNEVTHLFSRLQMGVPLNPGELRNALLSPMRHVIDVIATSHLFFTESRISSNRYKRQDYVTHAFAMAAYRGASDIKAPNLKSMVRDHGKEQIDEILRYSREVGEALNVLAEVNRRSKFLITQKWMFVDLCWLVMQHQANGAAIDAEKLASAYMNFEALRRRYTSSADELLRGPSVTELERHLYNYIVAFRSQGADKKNLGIRNKALQAHCVDIEVTE